MTEIIRHLSNGRKIRIQQDIIAKPLSIVQIQSCVYPPCPIFKTDIFKMDYEELKKYSYWKAQNLIISNQKKYTALCKRANLLNSSGQINHYDWRHEHLRIYVKFCVEEEDEILTQENHFYMMFMKMFEEQIREYKVNREHMKPILVKRFTKDLRIIREYTYDYPAHWKARGYKVEQWMLREAKSKIVKWFIQRKNLTYNSI